VIRAQAIVGAPSYEESLAALGSASGSQDGRDGQPADPRPADPQAAEAEDDASPAQDDEPPADGHEPPADGHEPQVLAPYSTEEPQVLRLAAVHLGGIANLEPAESGIQLRLSEDGLDIARGPVELLGRLRWAEIRSLDVPPARGLRRRRRGGGAQLVIRTRHGDATFEVPMASAEELDAQLAPLRQRHLPA
jgi:hypothetical protein